jgi:predicted dienelactone hydrolase
MPAPFLMFHSDIGNLYRALKVKAGGPPHSFSEFSYEGFGESGPHPPVYRVMLRDTQHIGLSDNSLFMRRPVRDGILGTAPASAMIGAQNDFVLGFFDRYLKGANNRFPERELAAYADWVKPVADSGVRAWWAAKSAAERAAIEARIARAKATAPP